jgi:hypothetical protein
LKHATNLIQQRCTQAEKQIQIDKKSHNNYINS